MFKNFKVLNKVLNKVLTMSNRPDPQCCAVFWSIVAFIMFMCALEVGVGFGTKQRYSEETCFLKNATAPDYLPTQSFVGDWDDCDCGKKCRSKSPCLKLIIDISDGKNNVIIIKSTIDSKSDGDSCTFHNKNCNGDDGEWGLESRMTSGLKKIEYYQNLIQKNEPIKCWINDDRNKAALENEVDLTALIIFCSILFVSLIIVIVILIYMKKKNNVVIDVEKGENGKENNIDNPKKNSY